MSASPPTAEELAGARWFGGKAAGIASVEVEDRLELGGGAALSILLVDGADRYLWTEGDVASAICTGTVPVANAWEFRDIRVTPVSAARPIGVDQSNTSYVVDERLVVKLYRRVWPGTHPEVELVEFLTGRVDSVPAFAGSCHWRGHAIGLLQDYVPGGIDGWRWGADAIISGDATAIGRLGEVTAELHAALAGLGAETAAPSVTAAWRAAAEAQLERAMALVPESAAAQLEDYAPRIRAELAPLAAPAEPPVLQRVHGDYHVGQILRAGERLVVLDFEGEPTKPVVERSAPGTPLRDVAAMLRSFDHLGRYVDREAWPGHAANVDRWIERSRSAFLEGYGPVDEALLRALEVEKECYEFIYAAGFEPSWMYAPEGGMRWLMEHDG